MFFRVWFYLARLNNIHNYGKSFINKALENSVYWLRSVYQYRQQYKSSYFMFTVADLKEKRPLLQQDT